METNDPGMAFNAATARAQQSYEQRITPYLQRRDMLIAEAQAQFERDTAQIRAEYQEALSVEMDKYRAIVFDVPEKEAQANAIQANQQVP